MVTVGLNGKIDAEEAAKILGCSYPHIINLIHKNKIKAQKIGKTWLVDSEDCYKAKQTHLVTPRPRKSKLNVTSSTVDSSLGQDDVQLTIKIPKTKYHLINLALSEKGQENLYQYLNSKINELDEKIKRSISEVSF